MTHSLKARVIDRILASEGGLSNHADDKGGLTSHGLTKPFLRTVTGRDWTDEDVKAMTQATARGVYSLWLDITRLSQLPEHELLAWIVCDYAVHSGHRPAIKATQKAVGIPQDGIAGPDTQGAWGLLSAADCHRVATDVVVTRMEHLGRIVQADRSQAVFLVGWLRRIGEQVKACAA